jgi:DNA polymerase III delta subunit
MTYLFVGEDEFSKDIKLQKIKQELFLPRLESFNFEILYSKDLDLKTLQERLLVFPIKAKQRLILIRNAAALSKDIKQYLLTFLKKPFTHISLILDARRIDRQDHFFSQISRRVKIINFHQTRDINAFALAGQINQKRIRSAMRILAQLLLQGERPERILGALRYQLDKERLSVIERKRRLAFLLNCDTDIKTGRLKPRFALERLLIRFCCF